MACATELPIVEISTLSFKDIHNDAVLLSSNNVEQESVGYWTTLIRTNLETAQVISLADSDTEESTILTIDEDIMSVPRRKTARDALARQIAAQLYPAPPDSQAPIIKYEKDIVMLRNLVLD